MRELIVPFLAIAVLGCAPAASVVTAPVNTAANVATATTGAAAGVATTASGAAAGVAAAPAAAVAGATGAPAHPAVGGACQDDAAKFCPNMTSGIGKCLASHRSDLSSHCLAIVNSLSKFPNCLGDASRLCPNVTPSGAGFMACLRTRQNDLSEPCRQQMGKVR